MATARTATFGDMQKLDLDDPDRFKGQSDPRTVEVSANPGVVLGRSAESTKPHEFGVSAEASAPTLWKAPV